MLETVRENLKGTLVVVVIIIFIVPMVIGGVGSTFMGSSISSSDAATVNGEKITEIELNRMIQRQRYLYQQQGLDASSPFAQDEYLRPVALDNLTKRVALYSSGKDAGMAFSDEAFRNIIAEEQEFKEDGKYNRQKAQRLLSQSGYSTMSAYRYDMAKDFIIDQQVKGLQLSVFATKAEFKNLLKVTHQKRSFGAVKIPRDKVAGEITLDDEDLKNYYEANQDQYAVPEKIKVEYLELSIESLAKNIDVDEVDVQAQYKVEIENFSTKPDLRIAHILIEDNDEKKVAEVQSAIDEGTEFAELASTFSDDIATSDEGGELGLLQADIFPKEFEDAAYALDENQISGPVKTESGTHFIKVLSKSLVEVPAYEDRKEEIRSSIASAKAREVYAERVDTLGELTFSAGDLAEAADELSLTIQDSSYFDKNTGSGIADTSLVRDAAFEKAVYEEGHNSNIISLGEDKTVVLRIKDKKEAYTKSFDDVKTLVEDRVKDEKITEKLTDLASTLKAKVESTDLSSLKSEAETLEYTFVQHDLAQRSAADVDPELMSIVMSAEKPSDNAASFAEKASRGGDYWLIAVTKVEDGAEADMEEAEKTGFIAQLNRQLVNQELETYQAEIIDSADIKKKSLN